MPRLIHKQMKRNIVGRMALLASCRFGMDFFEDETLALEKLKEETRLSPDARS